MVDLTISRRSMLGGIGASALGALPSWAGAASGPALIPATATTMSIEGRTATAANGALRIGYPGVMLRFKADGPRATMTIDASSDQVFIDIGVDGAPPRVVQLVKGAQEVELYSGAPGMHRVEVLKRTESWSGTVEIVGVGGSKRIVPVALPDRRLMFIGDSITCGAGTDVPDASSTLDGNIINNGAKSFGRVLAARLGAQCHLVSYGGRGVIRDWQGIRAINNAPVFYERAMPDDPHALWDHRQYVPHAIGICLGTNDFNQGVPDQNEFVNAYVELVTKVRRDAPGAAVFLIDSPMTNDESAELGHRATIQHDYLNEIVRKLGSPLVRRVPIAHYPGRAVNVHPIASEHVKIADELEPIYRQALGWT